MSSMRFTSFSLALTIAAVAQTQNSDRRCEPDQMPGEWDADVYAASVQEKYNFLVADQGLAKDAPIITVELSKDDSVKLYADDPNCESCGTGQVDRVGINLAVGSKISGKDISAYKRKHQSIAWLTRIECPGAGGLRVHFTDLSLPAGLELYLYTESGELFGPYKNSGPLANGEFWSNTVTGSTALLALISSEKALDASVSKAIRFTIAEVAHMKRGFLDGIEINPEAGKTLPCIWDASCFDTSDWSDIEAVRTAVALMIFSKNGSQVRCTGGLVSDVVSHTYAPYFLTANHCISTQAEASSLNCVWEFRTNTCAVGFADFSNISGYPQTIGATLLSSQSVSDASLMLLSQEPPAGSWSMGWYTGEVPSGTALYRLAHPLGAQQSFSYHAVALPVSSCPNNGLPLTNFQYSANLVGATDGGSSGAPVMLEGGYIVGQLFGVCPSPFAISFCDSSFIDVVDGKFSTTYSYIFPWIDSNFSVKSPKNGVTWTRGRKIKITWSSTGLPGSAVQLELWRNGNFVRFIKGSTPNDGKQKYKVPTNLPAGGGYKVWIVSKSNAYIIDDSSGTFSLN